MTMKEKQSLAAKRGWADPVVRERRLAALRIGISKRDPIATRVNAIAGGEALRKKMKTDPVFASAFSAGCAKRTSERYVDENYRAKHLAAIKSHLPEWKHKCANNGDHDLGSKVAHLTSERMKRVWATAEGRKTQQLGEFTPPELRKQHSELQAARITKHASPNKCELSLERLLASHFPNTFRLNVKNGTVIGGKIPDFVSAEHKVVVEMFGRFWHGQRRTGRTREQEESRRIAHFASHGYTTAIIWQQELGHEDLVVSKVKEALSGCV